MSEYPQYRYDFWAVAFDDGRGNRMRDRWRLTAGSFEEACEMAQALHDDESAEYGFEQEVYTGYDLIEVSTIETLTTA